MDDATRRMVRAVLVGVQADRNQLRRRIYDYYADSIVDLTYFEWDDGNNTWDSFRWAR